MTAKEKIDDCLKRLNLKDYVSLSEKIGVKIETIYAWIYRNKIPGKWEILMNNLVAKNTGIIVNTNNGNITQHYISPEIKSDNPKIKKIINLLEYSNEKFLDQIIIKLEEFKKISEV